MNYILTTIDVEGPTGEGYDSTDPIRNFIWCKDNMENSYGLEMIINMLDSYNVKGLFFVDLAEAFDYGRELITKVIQYILEKKHIVGVHLHPNHMLDENRHFLFQYSKEEQYMMISKCTQLYEDIVQEKPLFFRAGKYSANYDTLDILNDLGYKYDFSQFYRSSWCGINPPLTADRPCKYKELIEIPVTTFFSINIPFFKRVDKIDLEMSKWSHNYVIKSLANEDGNIVVLFLHSFSFVNWRDDPNNPTFSKSKYKTVHNNFKHAIMSKNIMSIAPWKIEELIQNNEIICVENQECRVAMNNPFLSYLYLLMTAFRIKKTNKKAQLFILANGMILLFATMLLSACVL